MVLSPQEGPMAQATFCCQGLDGFQVLPRPYDVQWYLWQYSPRSSVTWQYRFDRRVGQRGDAECT
jgi:hypothetical protein